jgi:formylglycine-generating enzyme required for sulfatase activity
MLVIGDYQVTKELGKGPFGTVYSAEHRYLKTPCIVKVFPKQLADDPEFVKRFEKELHLLAHIEHPHFVKIYNASFKEGIFYFAAESIVDLKGNSVDLDYYLGSRKKALSENEIMDLVVQIAGALAFLHSKPYGEKRRCHWGVKPSNILIDLSGGAPCVKLADVGMMQLLGPAFVLTQNYLSLAQSLGAGDLMHGEKSPLLNALVEKLPHLHSNCAAAYTFLAPELRCSDSATTVADERADIYSLGILIYYLLAGCLPEGAFPLPSQCRKSLKKDWDSVIHKALHPDPSKRSQSVNELMQILETGPLEVTQPRVSLKPVIKPQELVRPSFDEDPGAIFQTETTVARYIPKPAEYKEIEPIPADMVIIPGGTYFRGSNHGGRDELPRHTVRLSSFAMDVHPVTNEQFLCFLEVLGGEKNAQNNDIIRLRDSRIKKTAGKFTIESGYARHPVVGVTWYGAVAYAKWVGKRLPTEAEWEIAASGGKEENNFPTGASIERSHANFFSSDTTAVMSYPPQGFGLYDMAGNVYEWCQDWYDYHYYDISVQEPEDPKGPQQGVYRVLRGGCWKSLIEDMRCGHRHRNNPGTMTGTYGFRCAADVS